MEKVVAGVGLVVLLACAGCGGAVDANGIPLDHVPAGYQAKECHFEDIQSAPTDGQRWQRLVCKHGSS